jgi:ribosomal protein S9
MQDFFMKLQEMGISPAVRMAFAKALLSFQKFLKMELSKAC